jgi:peptide-methionine (S)-S-oxide reductase
MLSLAACGDARGDAASASAAEPAEVRAEGRALFAAGCFWCVEEAFEKVAGVAEVISGYTGGDVENPSYRQVTTGRTGHYEAVEVRFDPAEVSYAELLAVYWRNVDPTDDGGQFCDRGSSYRGAIFPVDAAQRRAAEASKAALEADAAAPSPIVTPIIDPSPFYAAEDYHQDYYRKNPLRYGYYKAACGRERRLDEVWGNYRPDFDV